MSSNLAAIPSLPVHLTGGPSLWDEIVGTATGVAALLAAYAIVQTKRQSDHNAKALVRERRIDFELTVLRDILETMRPLYPASTSAARDRRKALLLMLDESRLSLVRAVDGLPSAVDIDSVMAERRAAQAPHEYRDAYATCDRDMLDEIEREIRTLLRARPQ